MDAAGIAGAAMTVFGKAGERTVRDLTEEAVAGALADANMTPDDVQMVFYGNAAAGLLQGQEMMRGQAALRNTGLAGLPIFNVENACASGSSAFNRAWRAVGSGEVDVALAVGAEKLTHEDRTRSFAALASAVDRSMVTELIEGLGLEAGGEGQERSLFMDLYAQMAEAYSAASGATVRDFAAVASKNHRHGALNPKAQYRNLLSVEEVLASRQISGPLTLFMCSPIGDGAAALVVCTPAVAERAGVRAVEVAASVVVSGVAGATVPAVERASKQAYEMAGIGPESIDVVELHDAAAPAELIIYEELGLCSPGDGPKLLASGDTKLGGRAPANPSGGLLSRGHPVGATGCAQLVELADQLRGRCGDRQVVGARVALAENAGGWLGPDPAAAAVTILRS